ncbi:MAG: mechanosensitive ion channel family protein [Oscillospiraceae bacterium]|nr:mechanosensitive ion channel family protein [Oscillospiraceae bacterium]
MKKKKRKAKTFLGIVLVAILALLLANPNWLPLPEELKTALMETEKKTFLIQSDAHTTVAQLLTLVLALAIVWLVYKLVKLILGALARKGGRTQTVVNLVSGLLKYIAVIIAVVWGLSILGVNATAVLAGVGIVGLILGFGAQSLIEDIITGAFIIFENQYSVGDIIILDDFRGTVRNIGVRTTVIEDAGGNLKVVNNSDIRNFQNRSRNNSVALVLVAVAYSTDLRKLEMLLQDRLPALKAEHPDLYLTVPRYLGVEELADSGVNLKFAVDVTEENIFAAQRMLARDLKNLFDDYGVEIPFPQVVVHRGD